LVTLDQFLTMSFSIQNKCNTLIKERDAVSTIMETKIKVLVQSVAQSAGAVVSSNPAIGKSQAGAALTKVGCIDQI